MVCYDVAIKPTLQPLPGEELNRGANTAQDARLDVHCRGFWEKQRAAFFDVRICHPIADWYKELSPKQIYKLHEDEKKQKYASRIIEVENGTFTPLVFTTTGIDCEQSLSFPSVFLAFIRNLHNINSTRGGFQEQKPTTRSLQQEVCLRSVSDTIPGLSSSYLQRSRRTTQQQSHGSERRCPSPSCGLP